MSTAESVGNDSHMKKPVAALAEQPFSAQPEERCDMPAL